MNRRAFLGWASAGVVSACVLTKIPTSWVPAPVRTLAATEFLRRTFLAYQTKTGQVPRVIVADGALFEAYRSELVANIRAWTRDDEPVYAPTLRFKGVPVHQSQIRTDGWSATLVGGERDLGRLDTVDDLDADKYKIIYRPVKGRT